MEAFFGAFKLLFCSLGQPSNNKWWWWWLPNCLYPLSYCYCSCTTHNWHSFSFSFFFSLLSVCSGCICYITASQLVPLVSRLVLLLLFLLLIITAIIINNNNNGLVTNGLPRQYRTCSGTDCLSLSSAAEAVLHFRCQSPMSLCLLLYSIPLAT